MSVCDLLILCAPRAAGLDDKNTRYGYPVFRDETSVPRGLWLVFVLASSLCIPHLQTKVTLERMTTTAHPRKSAVQ